MPRAVWGVALAAIAFALCEVASAQPMPLSPTAGPGVPSTVLPPEPLPEPLPEPTRTLPANPSLATTPIGNPPPILGAPVRPLDRAPQNATAVIPASGDRTDNSGASIANSAGLPFSNSENTAQPVRRAVLGMPTDGTFTLPSHTLEAPAAPPPPVDPNEFLRTRSILPGTSSGPPKEHSADKFGGDFGEKLTEVLGKRNEWFKSDHAFDGFISPVTNPFLFEDPRSLTEARTIFAIEKIPNSEPDFRGGNTFFFGTQLRLAITDRLSFTIDKFGLESVNPGSGSEFHSDTGFAEFWFSPKYTFIRDENTGTLLAGGLQFQIPTGNKSNFQDTGSLSLVPYVSYAQSFLRDFSAGSFNGMLGAGYSFSVNNERSDYFYLSAHVDMNVLNQNHFFPLLEMNWFTYTTNGKNLPIGIEGQDLINFGGQARGQGLLTGAIGMRYKINENYQFGGAFEIPFAGPKDLMDYRFTLDFIVRY